jgi:UDP-N-acetylglucosamine 2-epimerase (non-hydrolysing)
MTMPEEINRLVTDRLCDLLLIPDPLSGENLRKEGVAGEKIVFVGNIMIDTLEANRETAAALEIDKIIEHNKISAPKDKAQISNFKIHNYSVITLHRPSNVDKKEILEPIIRLIVEEISKDMPLVWPMHPRTRKQLEIFDLWEEITNCDNIILLHPIDYLEMLRLNMSASVMLTDSGGLQEECTILGTPCLTLRWNTERPITLTEHKGASILVGNDIESIRNAFSTALVMGRKPHRPELWDGRTAERCVEAIINFNN